MTDIFKIILGIMIPFVGTALGTAAVFILRRGMSDTLKRAMLGFAAGVMTAASVWSLLIPAIEMTGASGVPAWVPAAVGFMAGVLFLLALDKAIPEPGGKAPLGRDGMLFLAVTLHNIPEGMAVGVVFAGVLADGAVLLPEAFALSVGIAVQNFPEGSIISMPLRAGGMNKTRAFLYGALSGAVEPVAAALTMALASVITPVMPYVLSFAAGAMIYVVSKELIPGAVPDEGDAGVISMAVGFTLMMLLDVATG